MYFKSEQITHNIVGTSHGINFEDMDVAALLKDDTEDDAFSEVKVCIIKSTTIKVLLKSYPRIMKITFDQIFIFSDDVESLKQYKQQFIE